MAARLNRVLGLPGAVLMGLGSMVGTGVFVSIGVATDVAGAAVLPAIAVAAFVALCNALSSAQLAAAHPVSGGTYEYGYRYLTPSLGFCAGWLFLCAKSASAATAALAFTAYLFQALSLPPPSPLPAAALCLLMSLLVAGGLKRGHLANTLIVSITLLSLLLFCALTLPRAADNLPALHNMNQPGFAEACALLFVAYTGYGRIATLGEEIRDPARNIPRAILAVMAITALLYALVALGALGAVGPAELGRLTRESGAPLESILRKLHHPTTATLLALGAMTALLGVLLNLLLGLSRVLLAMGRRRDMPALFASLHNDSPRAAVWGVGLLVTSLALYGDLRLTWSFSAFTVLLYYALTNLAALRLPPSQRLYPRAFALAGLAACAFLAFQVERDVWITGSLLLAAGLLLRFVSLRLRSARAE